jgi:hypothetical protein
MMDIIERSVTENCETGKRTEINVIHDRELRNNKHEGYY